MDAAFCFGQVLQDTSALGVPVPYTVALVSPVYTAVESTWMWDASLSGTTISGTVSEV
jgi:hypothetical protein